MDDIKSVLNLITRDCFMASIDLKDAYYSVKIDESFQKYLKFIWHQKLYEFVCFANGLSPCPRKFTKLTKVPLFVIRLMGIAISGYIDDFFTKASSFKQCETYLTKIINIFQELGFIIHPEKSQIVPSQELKFIGFIINSREMAISLTPEKKAHIKNIILKILRIRKPTIRFLEKIIGSLVASLPSVKFGRLHYRQLETEKDLALKNNKGNFDTTLFLTPAAKNELKWWLENITQSSNWIHPPAIHTHMYYDASDYAWGSSFQQQKTGGPWDVFELDYLINVKEMLAIYYSLRSFMSYFKHSHVKIFCDNTTAVAVVNKMGSSKSLQCNNVAHKIWQFCEKNNIWLTCAHIPGSKNTDADCESRKSYKDSEWMLNPKIFKYAVAKLNFSPDIDCFATRTNSQLDNYISYKPDPFALYIDAFRLSWNNFKCYAFPPFSLIGRVLRKLQVDQATALVVVPKWPTQTWFTTFQNLSRQTLQIKPDVSNLILPNNSATEHPLAQKTTFMIGLLSGKIT